MKIPRDLTGRELIKKLRTLGYDHTRQVGSHIRLTTLRNGTHHITIPNHDPLKLGTLSSILSEVAAHFNLSKDELIDKLF
ncbi:MAG: type II toxin-antitoxin system HicA family toxin [Flavipsychrobacter sp.]|nr:type II toxin-antitoxin system HicA family toxin [Flavipsychrobacter sp.]